MIFNTGFKYYYFFMYFCILFGLCVQYYPPSLSVSGLQSPEGWEIKQKDSKIQKRLLIVTARYGASRNCLNSISFLTTLGSFYKGAPIFLRASVKRDGRCFLNLRSDEYEKYKLS